MISLLFLGNKWTPFYLSFAREEPTIGEVALYDFEQGSKCVLYGKDLRINS